MAREGILFVLIPLLAGTGLLILLPSAVSYVVFALMCVLSGYFAFFFRDPRRRITAADDEIVSPVDGTVLDVIRDSEHTRIIIFLSIFNVHVTRMPFGGRLAEVTYMQGRFLPAYREKASELNEQIRLGIRSDHLSYSLRLIAGVAARRIRMWVSEGATLATGAKLGIVMFGSRAELILPRSVRIEIHKQDKVTGGLTLIGKRQNQKDAGASVSQN